MKKKSTFDKKLYECQWQASLKAVNFYFNNEVKSILWMQIKNPLLGNVSPETMLKAGRFDKLMKFIYTQLEKDKI
jgi:hypothetical protein